MWSSYRDIFYEYYLASKQYWNKTDEEMQDRFVFTSFWYSNKFVSTREGDILNKSVHWHFRKMANDSGLPHFTAAMFRHGCAYYLAYERNYSVEKIKDYFGHINTGMIERVYAPLKAEEKRQKVSKVIYDLITDDGLLNHASHSEIDEEIERIKEAIIEGKYTYRYKDKDLLMKALAKDSSLMANIRFVESK